MGAFLCKRKARKLNSRNEHFKSAKNENGRAYVMFAKSNPTKMRISPYKASRKDGRSKNGGD